MEDLLSQLNTKILLEDTSETSSEVSSDCTSSLSSDPASITDYVQANVTTWSPIIEKNSTFSQNFEKILKNKVVLNQKEIERFKKVVDGKKEGVWMKTMLAAYHDVNYMDLEPELVKYGIPASSLPQLISNLSPLVFNMFLPSPQDNEENDCLVSASNLEQPIWMYKHWVTRETALRFKCKDLLDKLEDLSQQYVNSWTSIDCVEAYKSPGPGHVLEFTREFVVFLMYFYDIVDVEIFRDVHCMFFKTCVQDSWREIFQRARTKNIVDYKFKFDTKAVHSKIELERSYQNHRSDMGRLLPFPGKNSHRVSITKVVSPTTFAAFLSNSTEALNDLHEELTLFYGSDHAMLRMEEQDILPFTPCVVIHNQVYQRAMVARIVSDSLVVVELTDFNWIATVPSSELMYLHSKFTRVPFQGFTLKLGHISQVRGGQDVVVKWLKHKLLEEMDSSGVEVEVCKLDGTKRVATVLMRVRDATGGHMYLHELMEQEGLVAVDDEMCMYHSIGLC